MIPWIAGIPNVQRIPFSLSDAENFMIKILIIGGDDKHIRLDWDHFFVDLIERPIFKQNLSAFKILIQIKKCRIFSPAGVVRNKFCAGACPFASGP